MSTKDLTKGSLSLHLVQIAIPLIFGNILQQFYNTIDALVIGRFAGQGEFAAIGVASAVMNLFLFALVGACTGISVLFAQFYGAGDLKSFRKEHFHALVLGCAGTILLSLLGIAFLSAVLRLIQTPEEIIVYTSSYLRIILAGLPAAFLYNLYTALLRSVGNTRTALQILALSVSANLGLDLLFVAVFHWGIAGAAWATLAAQFLSAALCLLYLRRSLPELIFTKNDWGIDRNLLKKTAHFSFAAALHQSGLYIGKLLVQGAVNSSGTEMIAAYTATTRIEGFANSFGDSGGAATSIVTAQNKGAGKRERIRGTFKASLILLFLLGVFSSFVMYLTSRTAVSFLLGSGKEALPSYENAIQYLCTIAAFYTLCFTGNTFAGYFEGVGRVSLPLIGAVSHISIRVILSWMIIHSVGLKGVAFATGIGWIYVNLFWGLLYLRFRKADSGQEKIE